MLEELFYYFRGLFVAYFEDTNGNMPMSEMTISLSGIDMALGDYLALICSIISLLFIIVICCLFIYRLIRLVGRLFSGGAL